MGARESLNEKKNKARRKVKLAFLYFSSRLIFRPFRLSLRGSPPLSAPRSPRMICVHSGRREGGGGWFKTESFQILDLLRSASLRRVIRVTERTAPWENFAKVHLLGMNFTSTVALVPLFIWQGCAGHGVISTSSSFDSFEPANTANH